MSYAKRQRGGIVAVDEIQMCCDKERGHVFTDRLLNFRGEKITMFLGSQIMKNVIEELIAGVEFEKKKDFQNSHILVSKKYPDLIEELQLSHFQLKMFMQLPNL